MGVDYVSLIFLQYAKKFGNFNKTITIGRQNLNINENRLSKLDPRLKKFKNDIYVDNLLKDYFSSSIVDSIDYSNYEGATIIHDMNKPLPDRLKNQYDTVIDSGTLEHIYNIPQALENCSLLCKPGGQIIHILPANNLCGHGFWQISPELFFSLYSEKNGYSNTEVFLAYVNENKYFYKVIRPKDGERVNIQSCQSMYVLVRTVLKDRGFSHNNIQQSDYIYLWSGGKAPIDNNTKIRILANLLSKFSKRIQHSLVIFSKITEINSLSKKNPHFIRVKISILLSEKDNY
jgi:SAM-dependent methyltransferase